MISVKTTVDIGKHQKAQKGNEQSNLVPSCRHHEFSSFTSQSVSKSQQI